MFETWGASKIPMPYPILRNSGLISPGFLLGIRLLKAPRGSNLQPRLCGLKKLYNLKVENYILLDRYTEGLWLGDSL